MDHRITVTKRHSVFDTTQVKVVFLKLKRKNLQIHLNSLNGIDRLSQNVIKAHL